MIRRCPTFHSSLQINVKGGTLEFIDDGKKGRRLSYIGLGAQNEPLEEIFDLSKFTVSTIQSADLPVIIMTPHDSTQKEVHITLKDRYNRTINHLNI